MTEFTVPNAADRFEDLRAAAKKCLGFCEAIEIQMTPGQAAAEFTTLGVTRDDIAALRTLAYDE